MVKFGKIFRAGIIEPWKAHYFNYKELKHFIKVQMNSMEIIPSKNSIASSHLGKAELINNFESMLDKEIKKFYMFFVSIEREIYIMLNSRLHLRKRYSHFTLAEISKELNELVIVSKRANQLIKFIFDNITALSKILKKFDKKFKQYNTDLSTKFIADRLEKKNSDLLYIFQLKIINETQALVEDMRKQLIELNAKGGYRKKTSNQKGKKESLLENESEIRLSNVNSNENYNTNINIKENANTNENEKAKEDENNSPSEINYDKSNQIITIIQNIENVVRNAKKLFREWSRIMKLDQYLSESKTSKQVEQVELTKSSIQKNTISHENKWNISLTLVQKWFMAMCSTLVISNLFRMIQNDFDNQITWSYLILAATPFGGIISVLTTKFIITKTYKTPMIISCILSLLGNVLFIVGVAIDSIICLAVSRLLIGFALNTRVLRNYLVCFIPKRKTGRYLLYFKLSYLMGISSGPLITLLVSFPFSETSVKKGNYIPFNSFTVPTYFCIICSIIILILLIFFYVEPVSNSFNAYGEGADPLSIGADSSSLVLDNSMTNMESEVINEINQKLNQFNQENKFSDTNFVASSIEKLVQRERSNTVSKAYLILLLLIFILNFAIMSTYSNFPLLTHFIENKNPTTKPIYIDRRNAFILSCALLILVPLYFFNYFYISQKINKRIYLFFLGIMTAVFEMLSIVGYNIENLVLLDIAVSFELIFAFLTLDMTIYFFTKYIPCDYYLFKISGPTLIQFISYLGSTCGGVIGIYLVFKPENKMLFNVFRAEAIAIILIIAAITFEIYFFYFQEKPIRRIMRYRNTRKIRRTEF